MWFDLAGRTLSETSAGYQLTGSSAASRGQVKLARHVYTRLQGFHCLILGKAEIYLSESKILRIPLQA